MVGGSFDLELNYDIRDSFEILTMFELFERVANKTKVSNHFHISQMEVLVFIQFLTKNVSTYTV